MQDEYKLYSEKHNYFNRKIENGEMVRKIDSWLEEQIDRQAYKQVLQQMDIEKKTIRKIDRKPIM